MALTPFLGMPVLLTEIEFHTVEEARICTGELVAQLTEVDGGLSSKNAGLFLYVYKYIIVCTI